MQRLIDSFTRHSMDNCGEVHKVMVIGDCGIGKTTLLRIFVDGFAQYDRSERYMFVQQCKTIVDGDIPTTLFLTRNDPIADECAALQTSNYEDTKCFIICYSLDRPLTFDHIQTKWYPQVKASNPYTPIVLVGIRSDWCSINPDAVTTSDGKRLRRMIGAYAFVECSFKRPEDVEEVFRRAAQSLYKKRVNIQRRLSVAKRRITWPRMSWGSYKIEEERSEDNV